MKKLSLILFIGAIYLYSCSKTNFKTADKDAAISASAAIANGSASKADGAIAKSKVDLMTAHPWMYKSFYLHYLDQLHKGDAQYTRGSNSNIINLTDTRITFNKSGTFLQVENQYQYPGTWQFTNSADTTFVMKFSYGTNTNTIVTLTDSNLYYTRPIGSYSHHNFSYTELTTAR